MDQQPTHESPKTPKAKRRGRYTGSAGFQTDVAVLRAQGMSQRTSGRMLGVDQSTIARVEKTPEVQAKIAELRQQWKNTAHTRMNDVATSAWDMVQTAADNNDAKSFDAGTRGLHALEKISSSVADVSQKVEVSGIPGSSDPRAEIKNVLAILFGNQKEREEATKEQIDAATRRSV